LEKEAAAVLHVADRRLQELRFNQSTVDDPPHHAGQGDIAKE
jgi:hypothetical protein